MNFGRIIKSKRKEQGLTQGELSKKSGIAQGTISKIEAGRLELKVTDAYRVSKILGFSLEEAMKGKK